MKPRAVSDRIIRRLAATPGVVVPSRFLLEAIQPCASYESMKVIIHRLRAEGWQIETIGKRGYRLCKPIRRIVPKGWGRRL